MVQQPQTKQAAQSAVDTASSKLLSDALQRGYDALIARQSANGAWEGEVVWCAMLPAQFVLMRHIIQKPISQTQKEAILEQFKGTQLENGLWGLHEQSEPYLFVTTLVYVAARLLGVSESDRLLTSAKQFIHQSGGAIAIPSWGKFWLAMMNLYEWRGVSPVIPEVWGLPQWLPIHPSHYYCHTRLIYMGMAYIYSQKFQTPLTPLLSQIRTELYPQGYQAVDFNAAMMQLRAEEVYAPPGFALRTFYRVARLYDRVHWQPWRADICDCIIERIRFDLQTTQHTCISPVSGLLNLIALWLHNPKDLDLAQGLEQFQGWIWQDSGESPAEQGLRIAGALSSTWDTSFALQAIQAVEPHITSTSARQQGEDFLATQQIVALPKGMTQVDYELAYRISPKGGFCFAGVWHGWPVSDCTAEAVLALINICPAQIDLPAAIDFLLQCQNKDGGFGSYERRRIRSTLEWINPAEMFASSMTEQSYIECTASCLAALASFQQNYPVQMGERHRIAIASAERWLRQQQQADGSWPGFWGVNFIYGTHFAIKGLLSTGASPQSSSIVRACDWLLSKQQSDGGWGEDFRGLLCDRYLPHEPSQVIQTAWALMALIEADVPNSAAIDRGAAFLMEQQQSGGNWPKQDPAGVFFHTALLDYTLYRSYFPLWALGLYATYVTEHSSAKQPELT